MKGSLGRMPAVALALGLERGAHQGQLLDRMDRTGLVADGKPAHPGLFEQIVDDDGFGRCCREPRSLPCEHFVCDVEGYR
jgi:hypothetical protein